MSKLIFNDNTGWRYFHGKSSRKKKKEKGNEMCTKQKDMEDVCRCSRASSTTATGEGGRIEEEQVKFFLNKNLNKSWSVHFLPKMLQLTNELFTFMVNKDGIYSDIFLVSQCCSPHQTSPWLKTGQRTVNWLIFSTVAQRAWSTQHWILLHMVTWCHFNCD